MFAILLYIFWTLQAMAGHPGCAPQSHAYGYQRERDGRLSGLQAPSECVPC